MRTDRRTNNDRFLARQFRCCSPNEDKRSSPANGSFCGGCNPSVDLTFEVRGFDPIGFDHRRGPSVQARSFAPILSGPLRSPQTGARGPSFLKRIWRLGQKRRRGNRAVTVRERSGTPSTPVYPGPLEQKLRLGPPEPSPERKRVLCDASPPSIRRKSANTSPNARRGTLTPPAHLLSRSAKKRQNRLISSHSVSLPADTNARPGILGWLCTGQPSHGSLPSGLYAP